jgi:HlyD family secretion protein/adhesin transport system membrane fusion protein
MRDVPALQHAGASSDSAWLTTPIEFEEERGFQAARGRLRVIVLMVAAALLWAGITPIRELSLARGQLILASQVRPIQHLEGGIVDEILVKEGDIVDEGQPLLRMNPIQAGAELATLKARADNLSLVKERVEALVDGRAADFGSAPGVLARENLEVYQRRLAHLNDERHLYLARADQRRAEIASAKNEIATGRKLVAIEQEQLQMRQTLVKMGATSRKQLLDSETALEQAHARLQASEGKLDATTKALAEAEAALAASQTETRKLWSEELVKTSADLAEVEESIKKNADRVARLTVRAPARGRVQNLVQRSSGEVVRPGETVARIVPLDELVAEVRVRPEDIASVKLGNRAQLKVTAYDSNKFGKIDAQVAEISPTTFEDEETHRFYYRALIRYDQTRAPGRRAWHLQPGMTVDAEIITGEKTLLRYLMKPISRGLDVAFSER